VLEIRDRHHQHRPSVSLFDRQQNDINGRNHLRLIIGGRCHGEQG
jgi:hypothetical protein